jgi:hypothetical protein
MSEVIKTEVPAAKPGANVHYYTTNQDEQRVSIKSGPYGGIIDSVNEDDGSVVLVVLPPTGIHYTIKCRHKDAAGRDGRWWESIPGGV